MTAIGTSGPFTLKVADGVAITENQLLTMDNANNATVADATADVVGVAMNTVPSASADRAAGDVVSVMPLNRGGIVRFIAAAAFAIDAPLYKAASGRVDDSGTELIGYLAMTAATAAGDIVFAVPYT